MTWTLDPNFRRATRPSGLHAVPDSQRAERFKARDNPFDAEEISPVEAARAWLASHPFELGYAAGVVSIAAAVALLIFGTWVSGLPDGAQRQAIVALVLFPIALSAAVWGWRKLA